MKKSTKSSAVFLCVMLLTSFLANAQWKLSGLNIYNTTTKNGSTPNINGKVGIGLINPIQTLDVNGRINVSKGVIQRGGSAITSTSDLGLYSLENAFHMRFVTNNAPFRFFSDGGTNPIGGTELVTIAASGSLGIRASNPYKLLTVNGDVSLANYTNSGTNVNGFNGLEILGNNQIPARRGISLDSDPAGAVNFYVNSNQGPAAFNFKDGNGGALLMTINATNGNVGIGTPLVNNPNSYKLAVNGTIGAKAVKVEITSTTWADFVFDKDYKLMPLGEVEKFINVHKHLPDMPSAGEIEESGLDVGEMLKLQMQKIEELTLYMIEMKKENDLQKAKILELEARLKN